MGCTIRGTMLSGCPGQGRIQEPRACEAACGEIALKVKNLCGCMRQNPHLQLPKTACGGVYPACGGCRCLIIISTPIMTLNRYPQGFSEWPG